MAEPLPADLRVLLVDNYDSYTWNIAALIESVTGIRPTVRHHDELELTDEAIANWSHVVLGPGPGNPAKSSDVGLTYSLVDQLSCPILGVCLGHQMLAHHRGGTVAARTPAHGEISEIRHDGHMLFSQTPSEFKIVRYHSLVVTNPGEFQVISRSLVDDQIMAIAHPVLPWFGVQFHPESICSEYGQQIMRNFLSFRGYL